MRNVAGPGDGRAPIDVTLYFLDVPQMAPALVVASACGTSRAWENENIAMAFLKKGALAYVGATAVSYGSSSDEFPAAMLNQKDKGKLDIGKSFKHAV